MTASRTYSTVEIARRLGVSIQTVQRWVDSGKLKAWKTLGGHRRIDAESAEALLATRGYQDINELSPQTLVAELIAAIEQEHGEEISAGESELIDRARAYAGGEALRVKGEFEALQNAADALVRSTHECENKLLRAAIERIMAWHLVTYPLNGNAVCADVFEWYASGAAGQLPPLDRHKVAA
ncbi:MAG: excisionase family DNA-binding protein [Rhizobacter sp.]